ncbi:ATP-dependent DNA helicase [Candidatus Synechococcus calcipolaris G9]|uniref:ATP-dependent DNA helicase n=1 Tax=Candidatus Synechococcus calcipolaris G9 TaxID=1497997 RepID=A0ABT6EYG9_9SYNE|nr:helicase C-terminal domain-containing protein [Candidatus Synechococcus calcipolaris]MDG2990608.1 ATP-dependent DNA helicase [Candidatus Synechococcus calcipolaris G9]
MIEADVHAQLRLFLRSSAEITWPHHLTLARLVARALRLHRGCFLQISGSAVFQRRYQLSYLLPLLLFPEPVILVAPEEVHPQLLHHDIPRLLTFLDGTKPVQTGDRWPQDSFKGLFLVSQDHWLQDYINQRQGFPAGIVTLVDGLEHLEPESRQQLTQTIDTQAWESLKLAYPMALDLIRDFRARLAHRLFQRPINPDQRYLLTDDERSLLQHLGGQLQSTRHPLPSPWDSFFHLLDHDESVTWGQVDPQQGHISLHAAPIPLAPTLEPLWQRQPTVFIGGTIEATAQAPLFHQRLGLPTMTTVKFAPDRHTEAIQFYLAEHLPLPNTPEFQPALQRALSELLSHVSHLEGPAVILVEDMPLRDQLGTVLAAEFGSRVQIERLAIAPASHIQASSPTILTPTILICRTSFWIRHARQIPCPALLALATLPIPSPEDPLVAAQIEFHKQQKQDWFRQYLLPECLNRLERAIAPVRQGGTLVALFDSRVTRRSYGKDILTIFSPYERISEQYLKEHLHLSFC